MIELQGTMSIDYSSQSAYFDGGKHLIACDIATFLWEDWNNAESRLYFSVNGWHDVTFRVPYMKKYVE